jgi:DNA-binding transcriptional regulator YiaG
MKAKSKSSYKRHGLEFSNLDFSSSAEKRYVETHVRRIVEKIRDLRKSKGLSQEALAELTAVSLGTIKFLEQNQRAPSLPMLLKLLYVLDRNTMLWD